MPRPNILLLHCHDLGRFIGAYGVPTVRTPHLDELAAQGVRLTEAYCTAPQCSPSRASLFTGRYPQQHGVLGLTHHDFGWDLAPGEQHLAQLLRGHGYATDLIGVHHESRVLPDDQIARRLGFDHVATGGDAFTVAARATDRLARAAAADRPFYLQVGFFEPHRVPSDRCALGTMGFVADDVEPDDKLGLTLPGYLHDDDGARIEVAELQGAVHYMDAGVGRVLAALREHGLDDDTIVVFTTDHGLALPRAKCTLYDPGLEVATLIRAPMRRAWSGRVLDGLVSNVDVVPTLLDLAELPARADVAGRSLVPMVESGAPGRPEIFGQMTYHDYYDPRRCVRTDRYKLVANFSSAPQVMDCSQSWRPRSMPRTVTRDTVPHHPPLEVYDLDADPNELVNVVDDVAPADLDDLSSRLAGWMRRMDDPLLDGAVTGPLQRRTLDLLSAHG